jgi:hypothetical protein
MTERDFYYWLKGYFELSFSKDSPYRPQLNAEQVAVIKQHLDLVAKKTTGDNAPYRVVPRGHIENVETEVTC